VKFELKPVKSTIVGGLIFLIPLAIVIAALGQVFMFMAKVAEPISALIPIESIAGIAFVNIATLIGTLALCFFAGLVARSAFGGKISEAVESKIYTLFPRYAFVKSMTTALAGEQDSQTLKPVLAKFDDVTQIAFEVERNEKGLVTLYLPGSPDPWSGSLVHMTEDRVDPLDVDFATVIKELRTVGRGASETLS